LSATSNQATRCPNPSGSFLFFIRLGQSQEDLVPQQIDELILKLKALEEELEAEFEKKRVDFNFVIGEKRVRFAEEVARQQCRLRTGILRYIIDIPLLSILVAPVIYAGIVPFMLMDLFLFIYQSVCFPVYGIPKVRRSDYMVFDREDLPYLNTVEKYGCFYCAYANGLAGFVREIAARTEQYFCPIKHARRIIAAHERYPRFFEHGDAESYAKGLERLRKEFGEDERAEGKVI
jgi:hypothetical protein